MSLATDRKSMSIITALFIKTPETTSKLPDHSILTYMQKARQASLLRWHYTDRLGKDCKHGQRLGDWKHC